MPEARITKKVEIVLTLTEEEAVYLMNLTQNSFGDSEDESDKKNRHAIFSALKSAQL